MALTNPRVTIMIPTYNQASFICRAIESALAQDYLNLEIIVSDDCSSDNTREVVAGYLHDQRLKYYKNEINIGRVANYKHTLTNLASGEWVVNLDGDDFYCDNTFISYGISRIQYYNSERIIFIQTGRKRKEFDRLDENGEVDLPNILKEELLLDGKDYIFNFLSYKHFSHLTTLYNRRKAIAIDFYRYNIESSDMESILRLALYGDVLLSKRVSAVWVGHENNTIRKKGLPDFDKNMLWIDGVYNEAKHLGADYEKLYKWRKKMMIHWLIIMLDWGRRRGQINLVLRYLWRNHRWIFLNRTLYDKAIKALLR
ncbi:glycosyltransferase family 2 protein [Chitinophaga defluvii]|uniref:Glycosyltransferase family 2 protein n=1 Tax=Chitinophaga defluvii TaxID=3163343 RepID=A0ABV2T6V3_9BACT